MSEPQEQWTKVHRKSRRKNPSQIKSAHPQPQPPAPRSGPGPDSTAARLTVSEIRRDHERYMAQWRESSCRRRLVDLLLSSPTTKTSAQPPRITRAVCLGIGSFDPEDGGWEVKRRAHVQLAAFLTIVGGFSKRHRQNHPGGHDNDQGQDCEQQQDEDKKEPPTPQPAIRCLFQEPLFTSSDRDFIRGLGHEVVSSPAGFAAIDAETLVFGVHLYREIYNQAIAACVPAVFVGTGLDVWEE